MTMPRSEQLLLPLEYRPPQEVSWSIVEVDQSWRTLGRRVVKYLDGAPMKRISVDEINSLEDPKLRYALRFQAAAKSMGNIMENEYTSYSHSVLIDATDEGVGSRLATQWYSGTGSDRVDTFLADIRSFAPDPNENY